MIPLVLVAAAASAQAQVAGGPPARAAPTPVEVAAQASLDTGSLLAGYMAQLAAAGAPPSQADIEEAARLYFTNGAAVTSVPTTGPRAAYFTNGAAVMAVPSSGPGAAYFHNGAAALAYSPAPTSSPAPQPTGEANAGVPPVASNTEKPVAPPVAPAETAAGPPVAAPPTAPSTAPEPSCSPLEIQAAMAIARQFAIASVPAPAALSGTSTAVPSSSARSAELAPASTSELAELAPRCPPAPPLLSRVAAAGMGGLFFGGFGVALWLRSRPRRVAKSLRRSPAVSDATRR